MSQYRLSGSSSRLTSDDAARTRHAHKGAGPSLPSGGRRPGRTARRPGAASLLITLLVAAAVCAALLAACGGSSGGSPSPSSDAQAAAPTPVPSPQITSGVPPAAAVDVVREFWKLVGDGRLTEAQRFLVAPGAPIQQWYGEDIGGARFVGLVPDSTSASPPEGTTVEFAAKVWIEPAGSVSPWGDAGVHQLFESVVRMSDGGWRIWESGTGP
jgi:hypothetical protein